MDERSLLEGGALTRAGGVGYARMTLKGCCDSRVRLCVRTVGRVSQAESSARLRWLRDGSSVVGCRVGPLPSRLSPTMTTTMEWWGPQGEPTTGREIFQLIDLICGTLCRALVMSGDWSNTRTQRLIVEWIVVALSRPGTCRSVASKTSHKSICRDWGRVIGCNLFG